jgi:hypothetical protein
MASMNIKQVRNSRSMSNAAIKAPVYMHSNRRSGTVAEIHSRVSPYGRSRRCRWWISQKGRGKKTIVVERCDAFESKITGKVESLRMKLFS